MTEENVLKFPAKTMEELYADEAPPPEEESFGLNDSGNADRFVGMWKNIFRYVPERKEWFYWNGNRWALDNAYATVHHAQKMFKFLTGKTPEEQAFYKKCLSYSRITSMLNMAKSDPAIQSHLEDFDIHPYLLNTPGGIIDLRYGTLSDPKSELMLSRVTNCTPNMSATWDDMPEFKKFISWAFSSDSEMIEYIQMLCGLSLIGSSELEHLLIFCYGQSGRNGKGTLLNLITDLLGLELGKGYAWQTKKDMITVSRNGYNGSGFDRAGLQGIRFLTVEEIEASDRLNESQVKALTGGDSINAAFKGKDEFVFKPQFTLWMQGNFMPTVISGGDAFWRRMRQIPFENQVEKGKEDGYLPQKLRDEGSAILAWMVKGAVKYISRGLKTPSKVELATSEYRVTEDDVTQFLEECCESGYGKVTLAGDLYRAYTIWCDDQAAKPKSKIMFGKLLPGKELDGLKVERSAKLHVPSRRPMYLNINLSATMEKRLRAIPGTD